MVNKPALAYAGFFVAVACFCTPAAVRSLAPSDPYYLAELDQCGRHYPWPFALADPAGAKTGAALAELGLRLTLIWMLVWYACALPAKFFLLPALPPSSVASENRGVYVGQKLAATLKVLVVASLANAQLWYTWRGGRFPTGWACGGSELAGVVFTAFEVADLLLGGIHGMMDAVYLVHHGLHIVLGLVLAANCMYCFTAAVLMSQETSTLFLNYVLLIRNRARAHWSFAPAFVAFAGCFFLWRLVLNSFGTAHFLYHKGSADATGVPDWLANVTAVVLTAAAGLQWWWGWSIVQNLLRGSQPKAKTK